MDVPMLTYWRGKDIRELDREHLIEIVQELVAEHQRVYSLENSRALALGKVEMWRRGERTI